MQRWDNDPLGSTPRASRETYLSLHDQVRGATFPEIDELEKSLGYALDSDWFENLALHTQVVVKDSDLNYQHGRILYSVLRDYLDRYKPQAVRILETGTARGFSSLCMARAISDSGQGGSIVSMDVLPHTKPIYWNCIDDCDGRKTRQALLSPWRELLDLIVFIQGDTSEVLGRLAMGRVNVAFLDARHTYEMVMDEARYVMERQQKGDIIVFDDVTEALFPGVVAAVDEIGCRYPYSIQRITLTEQRGYAIARRLD